MRKLYERPEISIVQINNGDIISLSTTTSVDANSKKGIYSTISFGQLK